MTQLGQVLPDYHITIEAQANLDAAAKSIGVTHFESIHSLIGFAIWDYIRTQEGCKPLNLVERMIPRNDPTYDPAVVDKDDSQHEPFGDEPFGEDTSGNHDLRYQRKNRDVLAEEIVDIELFKALEKKINSYWKKADKQKISQIRAKLLKGEHLEKVVYFDALHIDKKAELELYEMLEKLEVRNDKESIWLPSYNPSPRVIINEFERRINPKFANSLEIDIIYWADISRYEEHVKEITPDWRELVYPSPDNNDDSPSK